MGNRPIFSGTPTIEVDLDAWEGVQRQLGRVTATCDYLESLKTKGDTFSMDIVDLILALLCGASDATKSKIATESKIENEREEAE